MFAGSPFRSIGAVAGPVGDLIPLQADLYPVPFPAQYDSVDNIALPLEHLHRPLPVIGQPPLQNAGGKQFLPILAIHRPPPLVSLCIFRPLRQCRRVLHCDGHQMRKGSGVLCCHHREVPLRLLGSHAVRIF